MLHHQHAAFGQKGTRRYPVHHVSIDRTRIRRVAKNDVKPPALLIEAFQKRRGVANKHLGLALSGHNLEILSYYSAGFAQLLDECDAFGAAAQGLDSDSSGTGADVEERLPVQSLSQNIEQSFTQAVGGRTNVQTRYALQLPAFVFPRDYPHDYFGPTTCSQAKLESSDYRCSEPPPSSPRLAEVDPTPHNSLQPGPGAFRPESRR